MRSKKSLVIITAAICLLLTVPALLVYALYSSGYRIVFTNSEYYSKDSNDSGWIISKGVDYTKEAEQWLNSHYIKFTDPEETKIYSLSELDFKYEITGLEVDSIFRDERNCKIHYSIASAVPDAINALNEGRSTGNVGELSDIGTGIGIANSYESDYINVDYLYHDLEQIIARPLTFYASNTYQVNLSDYYVYEDTSEERSLLEAQMEKINNFSIDYTNGFSLNTEVLYNRGLLYVEDGEVKVNISDEDTRSICARNLTSYNTVGLPYTFTTHDNREIVVDSITYGTYINYQAEAEYLVNAITNWQSEEGRIPILKQSADVDITKTYIEVDESKQHAYYYKDNELLWDSDVVTGKPTAERQTHKGIYFIYNKAKDNVNLEKYNVIVQRWLSITYDGQGFHDASWRSAFGGTIYKTNGSHGCINTPKEAMYKLYDLIEIGTPVIIY